MDSKYEFAEHSSLSFHLGKAQRIAQSFFHLYDKEKEEPVENSYMIISEFILAGVALELFLKGILRSIKPNVNLRSYHHDLKKIYDDLNYEIKTEIFNNAAVIYNKSSHNLADHSHFEQLIETHKDICLVFRYLYEDGNHKKLSNYSPFFIYTLMACFNDYVAEHINDFSIN